MEGLIEEFSFVIDGYRRILKRTKGGRWEMLDNGLFLVRVLPTSERTLLEAALAAQRAHDLKNIPAISAPPLTPEKKRSPSKPFPQLDFDFNSST